MIVFISGCGLFTPDTAEKPVTPFNDIFSFQDILKNSGSNTIIDVVQYNDLFVNSDTLYKNNSDKYHEHYKLITRLNSIVADSTKRESFVVNWERTGVLDGSFDGKDTIKLSERSYDIYINDLLTYSGISYFTLKRYSDSEWKILSWTDNSDIDTSYFSPYFK